MTDFSPSLFNLGLTGFPLGHSLSPVIHKAALNACALAGDYSLYPVPKDDHQGLRDLLERVRSGDLAGLNVTIPHKQTVLPLLDDLTPTAKAIGAVNTIYRKDEKLIGHNTDAAGFLFDLKRSLLPGACERAAEKSALVLGAGGSACAVLYALSEDGWRVTIAARRQEQARDLYSQYASGSPGGSQISVIAYQSDALASLLPSLSLIVNTTPLGMTPSNEVSPWLTGLPFPPQAVVYDLVYHPRETKMVREARQVGLPAATGLGMLVGQAALAFEIWTGCNPPFEILWKAVGE